MSVDEPVATGGSLRSGPPVDPAGAAIGCRGVTRTFGRVTAVDDVDLAVRPGEWLSIVGPNGAGKTTLLNVLNGFYDPDEGDVYLDGEAVTDTPEHYRARAGPGRDRKSVV